MAYEPSAAASIQAAETSSPRERASKLQPTAPTSATSAHTAMARGVMLRRDVLDGAGSAMVWLPSPDPLVIAGNARAI
ncbi:hypothetical protein SSP531S_19920 [Streptomyces spongiicola]|uniref:Uncharacterized protein n=1 Tax=Streptomyces spongiicola TaxID=1690221 RepID=A0A388SX00_9ACTN|nr:hypothetical protein SSP531S_19920 [Streptomyces spongiicola]